MWRVEAVSHLRRHVGHEEALAHGLLRPLHRARWSEMTPIVASARIVGLHHPMFLRNLRVAAKRVLALHNVVEEVFALEAVGYPVRHVVLWVEGDDLPGMTDDGPLRRDAHADIVGETPVNGLPEGCEVLAVRESKGSRSEPYEQQRGQQKERPHKRACAESQHRHRPSREAERWGNSSKSNPPHVLRWLVPSPATPPANPCPSTSGVHDNLTCTWNTRKPRAGP